ncbi:WbuC family cupin fold metalloprotein [Prevotella sp.]|uniref:WbuC family cupin fold metalloprotein n=1 Tax=Prevotella sp. TaxID=59823 RepID=UPI003AEF363F
MEINKELLDNLFAQAKENPRLRQNYDLRTSSADTSQRMLNALLPGTVVPIHRHPQSTENVFLLCGKIVEVICDENGNEKERIHLDPTVGNYGCVVPQGAWHTVEVLEPSVIYEAKDGKYGEDGSEMFDAFKAKEAENKEQASSTFSNSLGDLKKNIEYLIGMERQSGSMDVITPLYVSRMLNVSLEEVEKVMRGMNI